MSTNTDLAAVSKLTVQKQLAEVWKKLDPQADVFVRGTIEEAVGVVRGNGEKSVGDDEDVEKVVLVTGSLHLVGGVLEVLEGGRR